MQTLCHTPLWYNHASWKAVLAACLILCLNSACSTAAAPPAPVQLPQIAAVPGGIAVVELPVNNKRRPRAMFQDHSVMVIQNQGRWQAIVGLPLNLQPGEQVLKVMHGANKTLEVTFQIGLKDYPAQYLTIKNKRKVNPNPKDLKRIRHESGIIKDAFLIWSQIDSPQLRFDLPVEGRLSSRFGLRRFFNQQPRKPHSGLDIAAPLGTPVRAPADATVIDMGDFFFNGNTLFLDHGQGLISMYNHLNKINVERGQRISRGQVIAEVGATGRVTGPHLHWSVSLNNSRVNPILLLDPNQITPE